jgi:hypothetical protein
MEVSVMKKNFKIFTAIMVAFVMTTALTGCGSETGVSREEPTTVVSNTTESSPKEETVTQEPVVTEEPETQETETQEPETQEASGPVEITITTVGGMYFDDQLLASFENVGYDYMYEDVKDFISESDLAACVIQTPINNGRVAGEICNGLANAGFDAIDVATVNCLDVSDTTGLNWTMSGAFNADMQTFGASTNANPYDKIAYFDVKGYKVAFVSGAQDVAPEDDTADINTIDENVLVGQVEEAKSNGAKVVVVVLNYTSRSDESSNGLSQKLAEAGANIVICTGFQEMSVGRKDVLVEGSPVCCTYPALGSFVSVNQEAAVVVEHRICIDEEGNIDVLSPSPKMMMAYMNSEDNYRLTPFTEADLDGDMLSDALKEDLKRILNNYSK